MPNRNSIGQNFIKPTKKVFFEKKYFFEDEIKRFFFCLVEEKERLKYLWTVL